MDDIKIPQELLQAIKNNELVIFVGAGLSHDLVNIHNQQIRGWNNLVSQMLNHLKNKAFEVDHLTKLIGKYEPIKILDLIEIANDLPKKEIISFTKDFFDLHEENNDYSVHKDLFQLSKKIVTTNYDTAFERSNKELDKNVAYKGRSYEQTTHKNSKTPLLFKLHGCYKAADSMVLFPSNYTDLYNNPDKDAEHSILILKNIILNKSILFIGTGMGDFQINNIFSEIKKLQGEYNQKHFIITKNTLDSALYFLTPISINDFSDIKIVIAELLQKKEEFENQKSPEILALEKQLIENQKQLLKTETKLKVYEKKEKEKGDMSKEYMHELLKQESLKYFSEALEFHLDNKFEKAIEKYQKTTELNPKNDSAYTNWGTVISELAKIKQDKTLFEQSFQKYQKATELNLNDDSIYYNWGTAIYELAKIKQDETLFKQSFQKYQKATELNSKRDSAYTNWGTAIYELAKIKQDETLFKQSFQKYQKATELNPKNDSTYYNWGTAILDLAEIKQDKNLFEQAIEKFQNVIDLKGYCYNLACLYAITNEKTKALKHLELCLKNKAIEIIFVKNDPDWKALLNDNDFKNLLKKYETL